MGLLAQMPTARPNAVEVFRGEAVQWSHDLDRVLNLPRRQIDVTSPDAAAAWTAHLERKNSDCKCKEKYGFCIKELRPIQGWALEEAAKAGGFLGPIGVGWGKEGICILAPWAMRSKIAVLFLPAQLKAQLLNRDLPQWSEHFMVPSLTGGPWSPGRPVLYPISYNELSSPRFTNMLDRIGPDLIICNEVQFLGNRTATRTKRFIRYIHEARNRGKTVRLFAVSGTLSKKSLKDYAHIAELALGDGSPLPLHYPTVEEWAGAIDASDFPSPPGELRRLCSGDEPVRAGFRRRLIETSGVVATEEGALDTLLTITDRRSIKTPDFIDKALETVRELWQRPDGEELVDAIQKANVARQLACGFFYRWRWPRGEPEKLIEEWLAARKDWHKEVRERLKYATAHMDSPLLVTKAAIRWYDGYVHVDETGKRIEVPPHTANGPMPTWNAAAWPRWRAVRKACEPETEAVWMDDFVVRDAIEWGKSETGIIWYDHVCVGRRIAKLGGFPHYGGGIEASQTVIKEQGDRTIVASIRAHGTGKNLQMFSKNLVVNPPSDGAAWEQMLARTHRPGQLADEVTALVYRHTREMRQAIDTAVNRANYISDTLGGAQKLLYATVDFMEYEDE